MMQGTTQGTCTARGDIDMSTAPAFRADLFEAIETAEGSSVEVECSGVTFMGSAGYRVLVEAAAHTSRRGCTLVIRNVSPSCARLLRLCEPDGGLGMEFNSEPVPGRLVVVVSS